MHEEMKSIYEELTPIEKYALRYLEETTEEINREELELAEVSLSFLTRIKLAIQNKNN